jgi:hypothetical protein
MLRELLDRTQVEFHPSPRFKVAEVFTATDIDAGVIGTLPEFVRRPAGRPKHQKTGARSKRRRHC